MKIKGVTILDEALKDLEAGSQFYEEREYGIGEYFAGSILSDIESLKIYAGIHGKHFNSHRMLSKRFPFGIYYNIDDDLVIVVAILDMRMNPDAIQKTVDNRGS